MIIERMQVGNFRSYQSLSISYNPRINVFFGKNGAGKTNLAEAVHYLSMAKSFRGAEDVNLIRKGAGEATVSAVVRKGNVTRNINILISPQGKKIIINQKPVRKLSELLDTVHVIAFEPRDTFLFDALPKERRRFIDVEISRTDRVYLSSVTEFEKIIRERNSLLKQDKIDARQIEALDDQLARVSEDICDRRNRYVGKINRILGKMVRILKGNEIRAKLVYVPFIPVGEGFYQRAMQMFARTRESDIRRQITQQGPHREDYKLEYMEDNVADFGSRGENRIMAIALKLCPYFLIQDERNKPIIVLDDVLSELDETTRKRLLLFLDRFEQVFITTTKPIDVKGSFYEITDNNIVRR